MTECKFFLNSLHACHENVCVFITTIQRGYNNFPGKALTFIFCQKVSTIFVQVARSRDETRLDNGCNACQGGGVW